MVLGAGIPGDARSLTLELVGSLGVAHFNYQTCTPRETVSRIPEADWSSGKLRDRRMR